MWSDDDDDDIEVPYLASTPDLIRESSIEDPDRISAATMTDLSTAADSPIRVKKSVQVGYAIHKKEGLEPQSIASAIAYALLAFQSIVFTEVFPLWAVAAPGIGLGFSSTDIGLLFSILGIVTITGQLTLYPIATRHYSPLVLFRVPLIGLLLVFSLLPLLSTYTANYPGLKGWLWAGLIFCMGCRSILENFVFTSVNLLVTKFINVGKQFCKTRTARIGEWSRSRFSIICKGYRTSTWRSYLGVELPEWNVSPF